jgi:cellulose synthase/poly-beta-1,6-N-acetylglucosamine synthase-like glycosyltransferase
MEYSVVIPVHNGAATLERCLDGLGRQSVDRSRYEVILVDDGSDDGSGALGARPGVKVVPQSRRGAAAARNRGLEAARGRIVLFLDADCVPSPDWLERMTEPLRDDGVEGVVGRFESGQRNWVARLIQLDLDRRHERMARFGRIDFVNTATCGFRREALGGKPFNETFGKLEDIELSFRLAEKGVSMRYVPGAVVEHRHPESLLHYLTRRFLYGRYVPALYRRHSTKLTSDSSTPQGRRLQPVLLGLSLPALVLWWPAGVVLMGLTLVVSGPVMLRAFRDSPLLGILSPVYVLGGNLAFLAGSAMGLLGGLDGNSEDAENVESAEDAEGTGRGSLRGG